MEATPFTVEFSGQQLEADRVLTFGRTGDLVVDEANRFLHRVCGEFARRDNNWWLINRGRKTPLVVYASDGTRVVLQPAGSMALTTEAGAVSFVAGPTPYLLTYHQNIEQPSSDDETDSVGQTGTVTAAYGAVLTNREREFLATFARPRLEGTRLSTPTFREVADTWGVAEKTVDNTVQTVRRKLRHAGISDIDSMEKLLSHLLARGQISITDLYNIDFANADS